MSSFNTLNKVMLIGRLGRDPEKKYTASNMAVCNLSLATSERVKSKRGDSYEDKTEWHRIVVFGNQAENVSKFLRKGSLVFIEGRIQTRSYQDKEGNEKYVTEIIANFVTFLDSKDSSDVSSERTYHSASAPQDIKPENDSSEASTSSAPAFDNDDDLPF